jgi:hypothetical protein
MAQQVGNLPAGTTRDIRIQTQRRRRSQEVRIGIDMSEVLGVGKHGATIPPKVPFRPNQTKDLDSG